MTLFILLLCLTLTTWQLSDQLNIGGGISDAEKPL